MPLNKEETVMYNSANHNLTKKGTALSVANTRKNQQKK